MPTAIQKWKMTGANRNSFNEVAMSKGHELLHSLHDSLAAFEEAVVHREHKKPFIDSKVSLQQEVDGARQRVVDQVLELVKEAREAYPAT